MPRGLFPARKLVLFPAHLRNARSTCSFSRAASFSSVARYRGLPESFSELPAIRTGVPTMLVAPLIIDVSCDTGMGFSWARSTTFDEPTFLVGTNVTYYAVDHSPSYLWNSATWEISEALLPYLHEVLAGETAWTANETLRRAIEIRDGIIQNPNILAFQHRAREYPHVRPA